jgi:hypothetical protein
MGILKQLLRYGMQCNLGYIISVHKSQSFISAHVGVSISEISNLTYLYGGVLLSTPLHASSNFTAFADCICTACK